MTAPIIYSFRNVRSLDEGDVFKDANGTNRTVVSRVSVPSDLGSTAVLLICDNGEDFLYSRRDQVETLRDFTSS